MYEKSIVIYRCRRRPWKQRAAFWRIQTVMGLQEYDLYAIKSYSFTVRKTNSFFSLPTMLLSIGVFVVAVLINFNTVKHLWLPIEELDIVSSSGLEIPDPLTSTLLCLKPSNPANKNKVQLFRSDQVPILFPTVSEEEVAVSEPELGSQIGSGYSCVDLKGFQFLFGNDELNVRVEDPSVKLYLKVSSFQEILYGKKQAAMMMEHVSSSISVKKRDLTFLKCTIYDRLYLNYDPKIISTVKADSFTSTNINQNFGTGTTYTHFRFYLFTGIELSTLNNINTYTATIYRKNIGEIFGAVLSWVSIFALIIGFLAAPLMDKTLNLLTAESLYHLEPNMENPSLLKFIVAGIKEGLFPKEDRYVKMCEQMEKMKDVGTIVKLQALFSRLIPRSRNRPSQELIANEHNFNQVAKTEVGVELFSDSTGCQPLRLEVFEDEKQENCLWRLKGKLLCLMDQGSDPVSVAYKKGGIGSKGSFCVAFIAAFGLLAFLVIFGVMKSNISVDRFNTEEEEQTLTIQPFSLIFSYAKTTLLNASIIDGDYKFVSSVALATGQECEGHLTPSELSYIKLGNPNIFCISDKVTLSLSTTNSMTRMLHLNSQKFLDNTGYYFYPITVKTEFFSSLDKATRITANQAVSTFYYNLPITKVRINSLTSSTETFQPGSKRMKSNAIINNLAGTILRLTDSVINIEEAQGSFFDAIENVWTFTIVCFTIVVMKLTKYINLQQKQQNRSPEKTQFRDSICIFLARMHGLLHGRHRPELEHVQHYIKEPLPLD